MKLLLLTDVAVVGVGILATAGLALAGLHEQATGAACGAVIGATSWVAMHFLGRRLVRASSRSRVFIGTLMGSKLMITAALVFLAVHVLGFDGVGMAVGLSALPVGIVLMALIGPSMLLAGGKGEDEQPATEVKGDA